jgi:hypothetical protein
VLFQDVAVAWSAPPPASVLFNTPVAVSVTVLGLTRDPPAWGVRAASPLAPGQRDRHLAARQRQERSPPATGAHRGGSHAASRRTDLLLTRAQRASQALSLLHFLQPGATGGALPGAAAHPGEHRAGACYCSPAAVASSGAAAAAPAACSSGGASLASTAARSAGASSCVLPSLVRGSAACAPLAAVQPRSLSNRA